MENFNKFLDLEFKTQYFDKDLTDSVNILKYYLDKLNECFDKEQENFASICFYVYQIKNLFSDYTKSWYCGFETKNARYTFYSIMRNFGLDDSQVSRILNVYDKFVELKNKQPYISEYIAGFSRSKLFELLPVDDTQLRLDIKNKVLRADMSVKTIRAYVKNYKELQKQNKKLNEDKEEEQEEEQIQEEEIPMAYNPKLHYDFSYFEEKTKAQLLNIVWQLQTEYEKLKEKNKYK